MGTGVMFNSNSEKYDTVKNSHKAGFWIAVVITVIGIATFGLAFSVTPALNTATAQDTLVWYVFFELCRNVALAVAVSTVVTQVFGLLGYSLMNKPLAICYIVFTACCAIIAIVCISIPAAASVIFTTQCDILNGQSSSDYQTLCVEMPARFNTITAFIAVCCALNFAASVLGCATASSIGRKEIVQTTYTHSVVQPQSQQMVVMTSGTQVQPQQGGYPQQPQGSYPPQGGYYPPPQGGYPPQAYYPPQGGYPVGTDGAPVQGVYYPPPQGYASQNPYPPPQSIPPTKEV